MYPGGGGYRVGVGNRGGFGHEMVTGAGVGCGCVGDDGRGEAIKKRRRGKASWF